MFAKIFSEEDKNASPKGNHLPESPVPTPAPKLAPIVQQRTAEDIAIESLVKIDVGRKGKGRKVRDKLRTWKGKAKEAIDRKHAEDKSIKSAGSSNQEEEVIEDNKEESRGGSEGLGSNEDSNSSNTSDNDSDSDPEGDDKKDEKGTTEGSTEGPLGQAIPTHADDAEHDIEMGIAVDAIDPASSEAEGVKDKGGEASPEPPQPTKEEKKKRLKEFRRQKKVKELMHGGKAIQSLYELWREQVSLKNEYIKEEAYLNAHKQKVRREKESARAWK